MDPFDEVILSVLRGVKLRDFQKFLAEVGFSQTP
jgi:hypothetical protein